MPDAARRGCVAAAIAILALGAFARPAHAYAWGDTLTVIWRPLPNLSAFAQPGHALEVWANAPPSSTGWRASLVFGSLEVPLAAAGGGYVGGRARWELAFRVPWGTREATYDLVLASDATVPDTSRHSVRVIPGFRSEFCFAQITDTHLPMHGFSSDPGFDPADTSAVADFGAVVEDLNLIHPEFVLHTGDLVNEGELEAHLGVFAMSRAKELLSRLDPPVFVVSGNHDLGGWQATAPPDGTSRRNWWRLFGWPYLADPPAGDPRRTQDYTFDYGALHLIGMEGYINEGPYDHYRTDLYGAQSFTADQMSWLAADLAALPPGKTALLFYHYDFGGTLPGGAPGPQFSQVHPVPAGLAGAVWGHYHTVGEGDLEARPFDLGLQATVDGLRAFRIFRVANGVITPGPMHHSGGAPGTLVDSLTVTWHGPNDGTRSLLAATVTNRFGEGFPRARLTFVMPDHDSAYAVTGGVAAHQYRWNGAVRVEVDFACPASSVTTVTVQAVGELPVPSAWVCRGLALAPPAPDPFVPGRGALRLLFTMPGAGSARLRVFDLGGRAVATPFDGFADAGDHPAVWDGRDRDGRALKAGVYLVRLEACATTRTRRVVLLP